MFENPSPKPNKPNAGTAADRHRDAMARKSRATFAEVSDIGTIPPVKNPKRRKRCQFDLHAFLCTYFPHSTGQSPFSGDHIRAIKRIEACILSGGQFNNAFPRGFGKSTISENSSLWALLYGHRKFIPIFGSAADAAAGMIDSIKLELQENQLLYDDFPEVCHGIRALEGKPQRCASQSYRGKQTYIEWTADKIALPMIEGSAGGGGVILTRGIGGATRGMKHKSPTGKQQRPDFVIIDDPQTDKSAGTDLQVKKLLDVIRKSILKLGGHDKKSAVVMNATVIRRGDLVDQVGDHKKFPSWQTERIKMVRRWADAHETLWLTDYQDIRNNYDPLVLGDQQRAHRAATAFYVKNRKAMDAGCEITWVHCFDKQIEKSAIQHAYNLFIDDGPEVFASECQNEPLVVEQDSSRLKAEQLMDKSRFNNVPSGMVPVQATRLVAHIDVMGKLLYWMVLAFDEHFGSAIVSYGTWPDEPRPYFTMSDSHKSIREETKTDSEGAAIYASVQACIAMLAKRPWLRENGSTIALERIGVDSKWGKYADEVFQACRESEHKAIVLPTQGKYYGAKSIRGIEDSKKLPGDRQGIGWRLNKNSTSCKRGFPWLLIDTNRWKTFAAKRLMTSPGSTGALMFNGTWSKTGMERHQLLTEHLTSEPSVEVSARGRTVTEWMPPPPGVDNHWLDNLVSCHALAAELGVREPTAAPAKEKTVLVLSELAKSKRPEKRRQWR